MSGGQDPYQWDWHVESCEAPPLLEAVVSRYLRAIETHNVVEQFRLRSEMRTLINRSVKPLGILPSKSTSTPVGFEQATGGHISP